MSTGRRAKGKDADVGGMGGDKAGNGRESDPVEARFRQLWEGREGAARLLGIGARLRELKAQQQPDLFPEERDKALHSQRNRM